MDVNLLKDPAAAAVQMLAAGARVAADVFGKRKATGTVTYSGNFSADDTVTINGVVFTAKASGATGNQFNIGVDLAASLTALAAVLNASVVAAVALATYSVSSTVLTITYDAFGAAGNAFTLAASVGTRSAATLAGGHDEDPIDITKASTFNLKTAAGTAMNFTLPDGKLSGQEVTIYMLAKGSGANAVVGGTFAAAATAATLDAADEFLHLKWLGGAWRVLTNGGSVSIA